jgi:hypothetical protein
MTRVPLERKVLSENGRIAAVISSPGKPKKSDTEGDGES